MAVALSWVLLPGIPAVGGTDRPDPTATARGPQLTMPRELLEEAVRCNPLADPASSRPTVLLVHGTAGTPEEAWGWAFERQLAADGYGRTPALPEADPVGAAGFVNTAANFVTGLANPLRWADREPDLPAYAQEAGR